VTGRKVEGDRRQAEGDRRQAEGDRRQAEGDGPSSNPHQEALVVLNRLPHLAVAVVSFFTVVPAFAQTAAPAGTAAPAAVQAPTAPLPAGARIGFVTLQLVFSESAAGKKGQERFRVLNDQLFAGLSARNKEIQGLSEKIQSQRSLIDEAVLKQWTQDLAKLQRAAQFAQEEADVQKNLMQQDVLAEFEKLIVPVINALRIEKKLDAILAINGDGGGLSLISVEPGLDLSSELIKRLNAK
jgi:Skp family chaperone for outer membrane proteins